MASQISECDTAPHRPFKERHRELPTRADRNVFLRPNLHQLIRNKPDLLYYCRLQKDIYNSVRVESKMSVIDIMECISYADQCGRILRYLSSLDVKVMKQVHLDFRTMDKQGLSLSSNIVMNTFLRSLYASETLDLSSNIIPALVHKKIDKTYVSPVIRSISEKVFTDNNKSSTMNTLSHFGLGVAESTARRSLAKAKDYKKTYDDHMPVIAVMDNIDLGLTVGLHRLNKTDCKYWHGTNVTVHQPNIIVPPDTSTTRKSIDTLRPDFIDPNPTQKESFQRFHKIYSTRCNEYAHRHGTFKKLNVILEPPDPNDKTENIKKTKQKNNEKPPVESLPELFKVNSTDVPQDMTTIHQYILDGSPTEAHNVLNTLKFIIEKYSNEHRPYIAIHGDQKIYEEVQDNRLKPGFKETLSSISFHIEIWHTGWTMFKVMRKCFSHCH